MLCVFGLINVALSRVGDLIIRATASRINRHIINSDLTHPKGLRLQAVAELPRQIPLRLLRRYGTKLTTEERCYALAFS